MLLSVALFSVPGGLSPGGKLVYAYLSYALFGLVYSLVNIPFEVAGVGHDPAARGAGQAGQRPDARRRRRDHPAVSRGVPQVTRSENLQRSLTVTTLILAVAGIALCLFSFRTSRETVERDATPVSLRQRLGAIRHSRPLVLPCLSALFMLTGMFTVQTLQVYDARDVLGSADFQIVLTVLSIGGVFVVSRRS
jgi:glucuronide carrier protein